MPRTDPALVSALKHSPQYRMHVLSREVEGKPQVVVLMGETHTKSVEGSELGKKFLNGFYGDVGVEGVDWENFILGEQLRKVIYGLHDLTGRVLYGANRQQSTTKDALEGPGGSSDSPDAVNMRNVIRLEAGHQPDLMENASLLILASLVVRTGGELVYRGGKLVLVTGHSVYWLAQQTPSDLAWKTKLLARQLSEKFSNSPSLSERLGSLMQKACALPSSAVSAIRNAPRNCGESVLKFIGLSPNDPTIGKPIWKRIAIKADQGLKYSFTGLFGANIFLYFNPGIPIGLINNRNEEMVENGLRAIEEQRWPDAPRPLLVIAGMGHLKGWEYLLAKQGFVEVEIP